MREGADASHRGQRIRKVVGGVIAALGAIFGLPLTYQTFVKTRAEITKINLESQKLKMDISGVEASKLPQPGARVHIDGSNNIVSFLTDPRYMTPLLVLLDALIAYLYYRIAIFAMGVIPIPEIISDGLALLVFVAIFYPVYRSASQVKKELGAEITPDAEAKAAPPR